MSTNGHVWAPEVVQICCWMYQKGFIASSEGNVSVRLEPDRLLVTPRGVHKGFLRPEHLVVTDLEGCRVSGELLPSSEISLHLAVYHERQDVQAVIHAHPTTAVACTLAGISLAEGIIPEVITALGAIPTVPYTTPGTPELGLTMRPAIHQFDAIMLARHGSVTVGADLQEAYSKLEMLEHAAQILYLARLLGPVNPLPQEEVTRLLRAGGHPLLPGMQPSQPPESIHMGK
ncbi:MAG: class II aldolase/adducin family protein [Candidatus Binatia bacterium]